MITSFTQNATGWLRGGSTLQVVMQGITGGVATFEIPGVVGQLPMEEVSPGRYVGRWTVPTGTNLAISGATVVGQLQALGTTQLIQAANTISVDTVPPSITNLVPQPDTTISGVQPDIRASLSGGGGSPVDPMTITVTVDGVDVTSQASIGARYISYLATAPLTAGRHTITVSASDIAGNTATRTWAFFVGGPSNIITSFTHSDITNLQPGDVITINMTGVSGGQASFSLISSTGQVIRTGAMQEISPGVYRGAYTLRRDDDLNGGRIRGSLIVSGETFTRQAEGIIGFSAGGALTPPVVTSPTLGTALTSPLVIRGTAPPNSRVHMKVEYVTTVLGVFQSRGVLADQILDVNSQGRFSSDAINLSTLIRGRDTQYTITAATINASGQESRPTTLTFTGG